MFIFEDIFVSNSEEIAAIAFNSAGNQIRFYKLDKTNFGLKELYTISLQNDFNFRIGKIGFTNDDKFFFVNLKYTYGSGQSVAVINIETAKLTKFDG